MIRGINRLHQAAQRLVRRFGRKALILLYHRVTEVGSDPWSLCVTPQHFAEHLEILKKNFRPMQLQQLVQALRDGNLPHQSIVVTFDDGYVDNLYSAKPLLECYDIPATFFLATGYIGCEREFWWDELEGLLLQPGTLPEVLHLTINENTYQWELGEAAKYSEESYQRNCNWIAWGEDDPSTRHYMYRALYQLLHPLSEDERQKVLDELLKWADVKSLSRPTHRSLSLEEVSFLMQGKLIEVGAHTVTHPALSALPAAAQREEIQQSREFLEKVLGNQVTSFAYPYGRQCDYTEETVTIVQEAGFTCACSNFFGVVGRETNHFQLPRVQIQDWDGKEFSRQLSMWFAF